MWLHRTVPSDSLATGCRAACLAVAEMAMVEENTCKALSKGFTCQARVMVTSLLMAEMSTFMN